jgi:hypothetical protein
MDLKPATLTLGLAAFAAFLLYGMWTIIGPILSKIEAIGPVPTL